MTVEKEINKVWEKQQRINRLNKRKSSCIVQIDKLKKDIDKVKKDLDKEKIKEFFKLYEDLNISRYKQNGYKARKFNKFASLLPACDSCGIKFYSIMYDYEPKQLKGKSYCDRCYKSEASR